MGICWRYTGRHYQPEFLSGCHILDVNGAGKNLQEKPSSNPGTGKGMKPMGTKLKILVSNIGRLEASKIINTESC